MRKYQPTNGAEVNEVKKKLRIDAVQQVRKTTGGSETSKVKMKQCWEINEEHRQRAGVSERLTTEI
jgi:ABC-type taurine transport system ATPase subunit